MSKENISNMIILYGGKERSQKESTDITKSDISDDYSSSDDEEVGEINVPSGTKCAKAKDDSNRPIYIMFSETLKFKIESRLMPRSIEMFKILENEPFSTIARFHLPCVRSYYTQIDGVDKVYMLASAFSSYMTRLNYDYKYFSSSKSPLDIVLKNFQRGYGTMLSKHERRQLMMYIVSVDKWSSLLGVNKNDFTTIETIFGGGNINASYYAPRMNAPLEYYDCKTVDNKYNNIANQIETESDVYEEMKKVGKKISADMMTYSAKASNGYVEPLKQWIVDGLFDMSKE